MLRNKAKKTSQNWHYKLEYPALYIVSEEENNLNKLIRNIRKYIFPIRK